MKMTFTRDVSPAEWHSLPRAFKIGESVLRFEGCDYGCVSDDFVLGGFRTIACCLDPEGPFFTVPIEMFAPAPQSPQQRLGDGTKEGAGE